jgi:hypothetical protein
MTAHWDAVLDVLERELDAVDAALASGDGIVVADLSVPDDLGPLPELVRPRAAALQARMGAVEGALALAAQRARQAMVLGDSSPAAGPSLFDARH